MATEITASEVPTSTPKIDSIEVTTTEEVPLIGQYIPAADDHTIKQIHAAIDTIYHRAGGPEPIYDGPPPTDLINAIDPSGAALADAGNKPDRFDLLVETLTGSTKSDADQVKSGSVPAPTAVSLESKSLAEGNIAPNMSASDVTDFKTDLIKNVKALKGVQGMVTILSNILQLKAREERGHPARYDITKEDEALQAYADEANFGYQAMTQGLGGIFNFQAGAMQSIKKRWRRSEFHNNFLSQLFQGFGLNTTTMEGLDKILTNFVAAVSSLSVEEASEGKVVNQTLFVNDSDKVNLVSDEKDPVWWFSCGTTIIYMTIKAKAWKTAVSSKGYGGNDEGFDFDFMFSRTRCEFNYDLYKQMQPKYNAVCLQVLNKTLEQFGEERTKVVAKP